jgi:hypothetical protein
MSATAIHKIEDEVWGFECGNCGAESRPGATSTERERLAGEDGWGIGLDGGQAEYACSNCIRALDAPILFAVRKPV